MDRIAISKSGIYVVLIVMRILLQSLALCCLIAGCGVSHSTEESDVIKLFDLNLKLSDAELHYFADGGTFALVLKDIDTNTVEMCISSARFSQVIPQAERESPETIRLIRELKKVRIYLGAVQPNEDDAMEIASGSELEASIRGRLQELSDHNPRYEELITKFITASQEERIVDIIYE